MNECMNSLNEWLINSCHDVSKKLTQNVALKTDRNNFFKSSRQVTWLLLQFEIIFLDGMEFLDTFLVISSDFQ